MRVVVRRGRRAEERRRVMRREAGLPAFAQVLAGIADEIRFGDERAIEARRRD